jgi:DNA-binding MltR family transcriptional regulator
MAKKRDAERKRKAEDLSGFLREFKGESDRGCALLGAALLEEYLRQLLKVFMVNESSEVEELISEQNSPLGSFYARTRAAFCLGLISPGTRSDLDIIRRVRNEFAHGLHGLSFDDTSISDRCKNLKYPNMWRLGPGIANSARLQFILSVAINREHIDMVARDIRENRKERREILPDLKGYVWDEELLPILEKSLAQ